MRGTLDPLDGLDALATRRRRTGLASLLMSTIQGGVTTFVRSPSIAVTRRARRQTPRANTG